VHQTLLLDNLLFASCLLVFESDHNILQLPAVNFFVMKSAESLLRFLHISVAHSFKPHT
jgi:hypothetical protein